MKIELRPAWAPKWSASHKNLRENQWKSSPGQPGPQKQTAQEGHDMTTIGDLTRKDWNLMWQGPRFCHSTFKVKTKKKTMNRLPAYNHRFSLDVLLNGSLVTHWSGYPLVWTAKAILVDTKAAFRNSDHKFQPDLSRRRRLARMGPSSTYS